MSALMAAQGDGRILATQIEWQHKFVEAEEEGD